MKQTLKDLFGRAESWPEAAQEELVLAGLEIEAEQDGHYRATPEELKAIDEALGQLDRGELASDQEVESVFAKFHRR